MPQPHRARRIFPPSGPAYELFDCSVFLLALGVIGYVLFPPPASQTAALKAPLIFISESQLGYLMMAAAVIGIVASYTRWLWAGYVAPITVTLALAANYFIGTVVNDVSARSILPGLLYGWIARRLLVEQPPRIVEDPTR